MTAMSLLGLPVEILECVIDSTMPEGFESLMQTCRTVYQCGKALLVRHNALKRQYENFSFDDDSISTPFRLLGRLALDPLAARYMKKVNLLLLDYDGDDEDLVELGEDETEAVKSLVERSPYLQNAAINPQTWWERMRDRDDALRGGAITYASVLLLTMLPNVQELTLPRTMHFDKDGDPRGAVLDILAKETNGSNGCDVSLAKLTCLIAFDETGYESRQSLENYRFLLAKPTLRELGAVSCLAVEDRYTGMAFRWPYPDLTSPLTKISLGHCCMNGDALGKLLAYTPQLRTLRYSHAAKWHGCLHDWDAAAFISTIEKHCGDGLVDLSVSIVRMFGDVEKGVVSMAGFTALRHLELDVRVFAGPAPGSPERRGMRGPDKLPEGHVCWSPSEIPSLPDILPGSLETLRLLATSSAPTADAAVLKSLLAVSPRPLSSFRVCISNPAKKLKDRKDYNLVWEEVPGLVRAAGGEHETDSKAKPLWTAEFNERFRHITGVV